MTSDCNHETYINPTVTFERRLLGTYVYVYRRFCRECRLHDVVSVEDKKDAPEWGITAISRTYNNDI